MAASTQPIFPNAPLFGVANLATAVTGRTVTGTTGLTAITLSQSTPNGFRVDRIRAIQNGAIGSAPSANVIRIWIYAGSGNAQLVDEYVVTAPATPSATAAGFVLDTNYTTFIVPISYTLWASVHTYAGTQDGYNIELYGGAY